MKVLGLGALALSLIFAAIVIEFFAAPHLLYYDYSDWYGTWWIRVLLASVLPLSIMGLAFFALSRATWHNPFFDGQRRQRWNVILLITLLASLGITTGVNLAWPRLAQAEANSFLELIEREHREGTILREPHPQTVACALDANECSLAGYPQWAQVAVLSPPWAALLIVLGYMVGMAVRRFSLWIGAWRHRAA